MSPHVLSEHNCCIFQPSVWELDPGQQFYWHFQKDKAHYKVPVAGKVVSNSIDVIREYVLQGQGIGYFASWLIEDDINSGALHALLSDFKLKARSKDSYIYALYPRRDFLPPKVRVFLDFIIEELLYLERL